MTIGDRSGDLQEEPLPFNFKGLTDGLKTKAKLELFETEETRIRSCQLLKNFLKDEKDLIVPDEDRFRLQFLRARKFDVKKAFTLVKNFYNTMKKYNEVYDNYDYSTVQKTMEDNHIGFLPYRDAEGSVILLIHAGRWNPEKVTMAENMRTLTTGLLHAIMAPATQIAGFKVIVDFKGFGLKHLTSLSPSYLWLFAEALQNVFPGRFRAVHVVNEGVMWSYVWAILKQVLTKKLRERFQLHGDNLKKLHKSFSPSVLPKEYGGTNGPFDNKEWIDLMNQNSESLKKCFTYGYQKKKTK